MDQINEKINDLLDKDKNKKIVIGISGIPGSGKSSFSECFKEKLTLTLKDDLVIKIIPLDGFHKYKKELNEEQVRFRGRIDTFDLENFKQKLKELKEDGHSKNLFFPSFQHEVKDPKENEIKINETDNIIIIEGLYLFVKELNVDELFDLKIFIESDIEKAMERVALRNFKAGISKTLEESIERVNYNDLVNAEYVLKNSNFDNIIFIKYI